MNDETNNDQFRNLETHHPGTTRESPLLTFYCLGVFHNAKYFLNDAVTYIVLEAYSHLNKYCITVFNGFLFLNVGHLDCFQIFTVINISIINGLVILIDECL